jgi:hypothetical protein
MTETEEEKIVRVPPGVNPISARAAASILQCSMGHVRWLRQQKVLKSWQLTKRLTVLDMAEVREYAKKQTSAAKAGRRIGRPSEGFSPDT